MVRLVEDNGTPSVEWTPNAQATAGELALVQLMEAEINSAALRPGDKMPTEREWAARSGQSRTVVRRALARLEARGRVVRHVGRGTFVASSRPAHTAGIRGSSPVEIMAVRLIIEPAAMPMVAQAARQTDFDDMERCLQGGENNRRYEEFEQWDAAFHRSLAVATQNQLLVGMVELMNEARDQQSWEQLKRRSFTFERTEEYVRDHRDIANAVLARDGVAAEAAMRRHLLRVRAHLLGE